MANVNDFYGKARMRFMDEVARKISPTPTVIHDNQEAATPSEALWIRLSILPVTQQQLSFGSPGHNRFRHSALIVAQIFVRLGTGMKAHLDVFELANEAFRSKLVNEITYHTPKASNHGLVDELWRMNLEIPFDFDCLG